MASNDESSQSNFRASAKRKRETAASRASKIARTSNTPNAYARRSPPRERERQRSRSRSRSRPRRSRSRSGSPPRKLKRPGARATADRQAAVELQRQREDAARAEITNRQVSGAQLVAQHYNAVPERGREWRSTESQIKGLRSVNNWIKSTLIQKFSRPDGMQGRELTVLDMACGKGGDLGKWEKAPVVPSLYVGCDIADVSISQARGRYEESRRRQGKGWRGPPPMTAEFHVLNAFGSSLAELPVVRHIGFDPSIGPGGGGVIQGRMGGGGFDVVSMMFALHYSFENETLARGMLKNVAGALKKGGRFLGVMPSSDVISSTLKRLLAHEGGSTPSIQNGKGSIRSSAQPNGGLRTDKPPQPDDENEDWDPERPSDAASNSQALDGAKEAGEIEDGEWNPEQPSEQEAAKEDDDDDWDPEKPSEPAPAITIAETPATADQTTAASASPMVVSTPMTTLPPVQWGNSLYSVRFPRSQTTVGSAPRTLPRDGIFRPPFGWKYHYSLQEAVDAPEFVVPFEALRALAEEYGLELMYKKGFREVFEEERDDPELGRLAERMGVLSRDRSHGNGGCMVNEEEWEAAAFYQAFVFYKT